MRIVIVTPPPRLAQVRHVIWMKIMTMIRTFRLAQGRQNECVNVLRGGSLGHDVLTATLCNTLQHTTT